MTSSAKFCHVIQVILTKNDKILNVIENNSNNNIYTFMQVFDFYFFLVDFNELFLSQLLHATTLMHSDLNTVYAISLVIITKEIARNNICGRSY